MPTQQYKPWSLCILSWCAAALLHGCATTTGTEARASRSGFDGARVVTIDPHGNACTSMRCTALGAQWNDKRPDRAILIVAVYNDIVGITGAQLNIDGAISVLPTSTTPTEFSRPGDVVKLSSRSFEVPLATIRALAQSKRTWLRVLTPSGSVEDAVIDGTTDSKAFQAMRRFLVLIDGAA